MADIAEPDLQATIQAWDQAAWSLAALALTAQGDGPPELTAAARELLAAAGLTAEPGTPCPDSAPRHPARSPARAQPPCTKPRPWLVAAVMSGAPKAMRRLWPKGG